MMLPAEVVDGVEVFSPENATTRSKWLAKNNKRKIKVSYEVWKNSISEKQRGYFFGCLIELVIEHCGDRLTEANKQQYATDLYAIHLKTISKVDGSASHRTLSQLTTVEAEEFFRDVREWASTFLGCWLPLPNEYTADMVFSAAAKSGPNPDADPAIIEPQIKSEK